MVSVRDVAENCMNVSGTISVNRDIFGYIYRDSNNRLFGSLGGNDTFPATGEPLARSLRQQLDRSEGSAMNLCVFMVGYEPNLTSTVSNNGDEDDVTKVQYAIQVMRDIYAQAGLGVRRIFWRVIPVDEAGSYVDIADKPEAEDLTDDFSGPNDGLDTFFVQTVGGADGWCNTGGPCDKDAKDEMTGVVLEVSLSRRTTGVLLAHEVGHYLGLAGGTDGITNLMGADDNPPFGVDEINRNSTGLTNDQASIMLGHCAVNGSC